MDSNKIAILYQAALPPIKNGIQKPIKKGGYSDSGADIAYELIKHGISIITPTKEPDIKNDKDWVFPDTEEGIKNAIKRGANTFWLNTVLYKKHPVTRLFNQNIQFIGQLPDIVDLFDDKHYTNNFLESHGLPFPKTTLIQKENYKDTLNFLKFPLVLKPLRGRGSQGVSLVEDQNELTFRLSEFFNSNLYGNALYLEEYLSGQEITITVMPAGDYRIESEEKNFKKPWCLPAVKRFNHDKGIAPCNGIVAVTENSKALEIEELNSDKIQAINALCIKAAELIKIKAPIRIDCRANENGDYFLFDINLKPNMTGPSRSHRENQDSLSLLAARKIGWNYFDFLHNITRQIWK